jgi:hypothetical protein
MSDIRRAVIKNADMSEEMQQEAIDVATTALSKYGIEKDVAAYIKKEFDKVSQHAFTATVTVIVTLHAVYGIMIHCN